MLLTFVLVGQRQWLSSVSAADTDGRSCTASSMTDASIVWMQVLGLVGTNGIGKSTALKVLSGKLKPNLGRFDVRVSLMQAVD